MRLLYDLIFLIYGILYLPYLIITKRYKYGLKQRLGILPKEIRELSSVDRVIWIHGVSVGEIKIASILAPLLRKMFPSHKIVFSTVTGTGNRIAQTIRKNGEAVIYLPFDISFITNKVVRIIKPDIFLCLETELWPNLITSLDRFGSKIILLNGRISGRSFLGYKKIRFIVSRILEKFSIVLVQSKQDQERIIDLGAIKEKCYVTGNMKFDLFILKDAGLRDDVRKRLGLGHNEVLLIAGSTHKGEEGIILKCYSRLKKDHKYIRLLIAPRHIERAHHIESLIKKYNFKSVRLSGFNACELRTAACGQSLVFILDTMGKLSSMYSAADIVYVGGSLVKKGGQNIIEPASLEKPVVTGKFVSNFQDVVNLFLKNDACFQVSNRNELYASIKKLLDSHKLRKDLGSRAKETVLKNQGSTQRSLDLVLSIYDK
ncbi:MAG: 3-deoxy-D-manno-octulosonic acid transferase [Candidatus Omnitrophota bacterium]